MYNRYVPPERSYAPAQPQEHSVLEPESAPDTKNYIREPKPVQEVRGNSKAFFRDFCGTDGQIWKKLGGLLEGTKAGGIGSVLSLLHLEDLDTGDILLFLILLFLLSEGDEVDMVITLGLMLLMGLGEEKKSPEENPSGQERLN